MPAIITTHLGSADVTALRADAQVVSLADAGDWSGLVEYLSADGFTRLRGPISRSDFLLLTLPALPRIAVASAPVQTIWLQVLETIRSVETIRVDLPAVDSMLSMAVSQGILTAGDVEAIRTVPTTRASSLLGRDVSLTADDLRAALDVSL